jgi:hypothetical protein
MVLAGLTGTGRCLHKPFFIFLHHNQFELYFDTNKDLKKTILLNEEELL